MSSQLLQLLQMLSLCKIGEQTCIGHNVVMSNGCKLAKPYDMLITYQVSPEAKITILATTECDKFPGLTCFFVSATHDNGTNWRLR